jgi:formylglycine-generating enzyme required for sulfatase activity
MKTIQAVASIGYKHYLLRAIFAGWTLSGVVLSGCAPAVRPQVVLYIDTDAVIPTVFDRLRVTVLNERGQVVPDGVREFGGSDIEQQPGAPVWPVSLGIALAPGEHRVVRAQLYLAGRVLPPARSVTDADAAINESGEPEPRSSLTVLGRIVGSAQITRYSMFLPMQCVGGAEDPACSQTPVALEPYVPRPSRVNSWHSELSFECAGRARGDDASRTTEVCIRGGMYWMGDRRLAGSSPLAGAFPEHLVVLKPFYLDRFEYTVGRLRAAIAAGRVPAAPPGLFANPRGAAAFIDGQPRLMAGGRSPCENPGQTSRTMVSVVGTDPPQMVPEDLLCCNYIGPSDGSRDSQPLNCVSAPLARTLCAAEGKRLVTEAEWEWAAGNREQQTLHSWGDAWQVCQSGVGISSMGNTLQECMRGDIVGGSTGVTGVYGCFEPAFLPPICRLIPRGADRTIDGVSDMMGNVQEIVRDSFASYSDDCWQGTAQQVNPVCAGIDDNSLRGGSFAESGPYGYYSAARARWSSETHRQPRQGFRCARDAQ